ncbi:hypothetical protein [Polaromonas sp. UC242_47]|uniref:hypothetical protein n=1 Tax=Polaromonas sp. UC242_47 TaxID=3374626 RepID=UPI00379BCDE9
MPTAKHDASLNKKNLYSMRRQYFTAAGIAQAEYAGRATAAPYRQTSLGQCQGWIFLSPAKFDESAKIPNRFQSVDA